MIIKYPYEIGEKNKKFQSILRLNQNHINEWFFNRRFRIIFLIKQQIIRWLRSKIIRNWSEVMNIIIITNNFIHNLDWY